MSQNEKKQIVQVNGMKVNLKQPFIIESDSSKGYGSRYSLSQAKDENLFPSSLKPLFQVRNAEQIQHIDQAMLQQRSVSSLRDFNLFAPPTTNTRHGNEEEVCHFPKKTLFINEFDDFVYQKQNP